MKQNNDKLKKECDMCKIQFDNWVDDIKDDEQVRYKLKSNVHKYCPSCRQLKEK